MLRQIEGVLKRFQKNNNEWCRMCRYLVQIEKNKVVTLKIYMVNIAVAYQKCTFFKKKIYVFEYE